MSHPRSFPRARQSGAVDTSVSIGVVFMLLVAAGLLFLLFADGARTLRSKRVDPTDYPELGEIQMPENGYRLVWRAREDGTGAPTLALFLRPNDAVELASNRAASRIDVEYQALLRVVVPSVDSLRADPQSRPERCAESAAPFAGCASIGVGILTLSRGESTKELYAALEELRVPRPRPDPSSRMKLTAQDLRIFRTQTDPQSRAVAIRSWSCLQGARQLLVPPPKGRCDPPPVPVADRSAVLFRCWDAHCTADFLFQKRLAQLQLKFVSQAAAPEMRMRLFLTAWEMLNRQQADAARPPDLAYERADTPLQLEACRAVVQEGARWIDKPEFKPFDFWRSDIGPSCYRVEKTAARFARIDADWATAMLGKLIAIYQQSGLDVKRRLYDAHFALLEQRSGGDTEEMFDAIANYLRHDGSAGLLSSDPLVPRAVELAGKLKLPKSDPRVLLVRERMVKAIYYEKLREEAASRSVKKPSR